MTDIEKLKNIVKRASGLNRSIAIKYIEKKYEKKQLSKVDNIRIENDVKTIKAVEDFYKLIINKDKVEKDIKIESKKIEKVEKKEEIKSKKEDKEEKKEKKS